MRAPTRNESVPNLGTKIAGVAFTGIALGGELAWDTQLFTDAEGAIVTAAGQLGETICEAFTGPAGPFGCPFAGEAAAAAARERDGGPV